MSNSTALVQFAAGVLLGVIAAGGYAFAAATRRGSFFVDDQAEVNRTMRLRMPLGSAVGAGLVLAAMTAGIRAEFGFVVSAGKQVWTDDEDLVRSP